MSSLKSCFAISLKTEAIVAFLETPICNKNDSGLCGVTLLCYFTTMCSVCTAHAINEYVLFCFFL